MLRQLFAAGLLMVAAGAAGEPSVRPGSMAGPAGESAVSFTRPAAAAVLEAGEIVEVHWSGIPADAEEIELLLSLDGGKHFSIRVTEELDAREGRFLWRVPNFVSSEASLAIRMGIGGREVTSAGGPLFRIERDDALGRPALAWRADEIWVEPDAANEERQDPAEPPLSRMSAPPEIASLPAGSHGFLLPRFLRTPESGDSRSVRALSEPRNPVLSARITSRVPPFIPQRI